MSWKNVKEHYRIGHIVQIREGRICIGSPYVSDLIRVGFDGEVTWGNLGPSKGDDLAHYFAEMKADPAKLKALIDTPDTFEKSLPVYTYDGGEILEKQCEEYGWPNITHDGLLQYENTFSDNIVRVIGWAKRSARLEIKWREERLEELCKQIETIEQGRDEAAENFAKLVRNYPVGEEDGAR